MTFQIQVQVLATEYKVDAILGGYSDMIIERQAEVANANGIPYVNGGGASSYIIFFHYIYYIFYVAHLVSCYLTLHSYLHFC